MFTGEIDVTKSIKLECQNSKGDTCGVDLRANHYHMVTLKPNNDGTFDIIFDASYKGEEVVASKVCLDETGVIWMGDPSLLKKQGEPVEVQDKPEASEDKPKWF